MGKSMNLAIAAVLLAAAGCVDGTKPVGPDRASVEAGKRARMHVSTEETKPDGTMGGKGGALHMLAQGMGVPSLETYSLTFPATKNDDVKREIHYEIAGVKGSDFLEIVIPEGSLLTWPDGTPITEKDTVNITITVDPVYFLIHLAPAGLRFDPQIPVELNLFYENSEDDLDGDGDADQDDETIRTTLLDTYARTGPNVPWTLLPSAHLVETREFAANLVRLENVAVSW